MALSENAAPLCFVALAAAVIYVTAVVFRQWQHYAFVTVDLRRGLNGFCYE